MQHLDIVIQNQRRIMRAIRAIMRNLGMEYQKNEYNIYSLEGSSGSSLSSAKDTSGDEQ
jgi:hypothetical protein